MLTARIVTGMIKKPSFTAAATGVAIFIVALIGVVAYIQLTPDKPTPHQWKEAKATEAKVACLGSNASLDIPTNTVSAIEMQAMSYLVDVPAGTNVDVHIASYSANKTTGSLRYPDTYGNYNFSMTRQGDWQFDDFVRCN
jgi:hypothetical protein